MFRHQGKTGLPSAFQSDKALTFILIIGSWRNGETCGCKNKEPRKATEKLTGRTDYFSSCLELRQMTFKCRVGDMFPSTELLCIWIWMTNLFLMEEHRGIQRFLRIIWFWMVVNSSPNLVRSILFSEEEITVFLPTLLRRVKKGERAWVGVSPSQHPQPSVVVTEACRQINPSRCTIRC